ncbi:MAG: carbamoyl phosphate synthase small subunit [Oscillospiraceae bacterium]|nr:carbamoyl phosphate synthase small subunit [Oscillospiraceae bacterium]
MSSAKKAWVVLADGQVLEGQSFGACGTSIGEIVFNTGMTGYQEVLTDPSYYGQIVTQTYPLIGNYGINNDDMESASCHVKGYIVREWCDEPSNFRVAMNIDQYLKKQNIIAVSGIDTRRLTKTLRENGVMNGAVTTEYSPEGKDALLQEIRTFAVRDAVKAVSCEKPFRAEAEHPSLEVVLMDFGHKRNITRSLVSRGCNVTVVPCDATAEEILAGRPDGVMLSNGPGDPAENVEIIAEIAKLLRSGVPVFGICLGHQLTALAAGGRTAKLKYGHRGANQPVKDLKLGRTYITSQNHGYAVVGESLDPAEAVISHVNANDGTVEGVEYLHIPCFTVQFHPEASAGPRDTSYLFDRFVDMMNAYHKEAKQDA